MEVLVLVPKLAQNRIDQNRRRIETAALELFAKQGFHGTNTREIAEKAEQTFESALGQIKPAAAAVIAKLRDLSDPPEQVGIEFGIKLGAKAGAFITSADAEATFKITLTWKRESK